MFKTEITSPQGKILSCEFQQADYPLVNVNLSNDLARITTLPWTGKAHKKAEAATDQFLISITIPASDFRIITDEFSDLSEKLSLPVRNIVTEILNCSCRPKFKKAYLKTKVYELIIQLLSSSPAEPAGYSWTEKERSVFTGLRDLISQNLQKNYSIEELSDIAGMNRTKMQAGFKALFGQTIYTYTLDVKMSKAKSLLSETREIRMKEIAAMLGYNHSNHFSSAFKKKFAVSPSFFRKGISAVSLVAILL